MCFLQPGIRTKAGGGGGRGREINEGRKEGMIDEEETARLPWRLETGGEGVLCRLRKGVRGRWRFWICRSGMKAGIRTFFDGSPGL